MDGKLYMDEAISALVASMNELGYKDPPNNMLVYQARLLAGFCEEGFYSKEAREGYLAARKPNGQPVTDRHMQVKRRVVSLVEGYFANGVFDLRPTNPYVEAMPSGIAMLAILDKFREHSRERGLRDSTCKDYYNMAREFTLWLEGEGVMDLEAITPSQVLDFLSHMMARRPNTDAFYIKGPLKPFLRFLGRDDLVECLKLVSSVRSHKIYSVLEDDVEEAVAVACCDATLVKARDAAMTLIALTTGLRSGDILDLRLGDIDWNKSVMNVRQNKTGNLISLPMQPAVRAALGRYVLDERPEPYDAKDDHVFLRARAPHTPIASPAAAYRATERVLATVGSHGGGTRLFRRNAATKMLRSGTPSPIISAVLGHANPTTTGIYMEMDSSRMRACVLALPKGAMTWL